MIVVLSRDQISRNVQGINVTARAEHPIAMHFAPTWKMVMDFKHGKTTEAQYTEQYRKILDAVPVESWRWLHRQEEHGWVILLCFCRDEWFCHTYLIIEYACEKFPRSFKASSKASQRIEQIKKARQQSNA